MSSLELILPFLGSRNYLHGTTLFDSLSALVPKEARRIFKFSRLITSNHVLVRSLEQIDVGAGDVSATLGYETDSEKGCLGVIPLEPTKELTRIPYDETLVTSAAQIWRSRVEILGPSPFSFVATIVPLNKALLSREIGKPGDGQWLFTRLDVDPLPGQVRSIQLVVRGRIGARIVRSEIRISGSTVGDLYFSWWDRK